MNKRLAVLISGRGSNLKSVLDTFDPSNVFVFTNKKDAKGLNWAVRKGCHVEVLDLKNDESWLNFSVKLNELKIRKAILLGFMKIIPSVFLNEFKGEVINLHPSVLPNFPGLNSIEKSLMAGESVGVSLHHVDENMDEGPLIYQSKLCKEEYLDHSFEALRVHPLEQNVVSRYLRLGGL